MKCGWGKNLLLYLYLYAWWKWDNIVIVIDCMHSYRLYENWSLKVYQIWSLKKTSLFWYGWKVRLKKLSILRELKHFWFDKVTKDLLASMFFSCSFFLLTYLDFSLILLCSPSRISILAHSEQVILSLCSKSSHLHVSLRISKLRVLQTRRSSKDDAELYQTWNHKKYLGVFRTVQVGAQKKKKLKEIYGCCKHGVYEF